MVGMVVTISPSFSLYNIVVFPAASRPTIRILISFLPIRLFRRLPNMLPMSTGWLHCFSPSLSLLLSLALSCNKTGAQCGGINSAICGIRSSSSLICGLKLLLRVHAQGLGYVVQRHSGYYAVIMLVNLHLGNGRNCCRMV